MSRNLPKKEGYHYLGRWKCPLLAESPWLNWGSGRILERLGVNIDGRQVYLDGHVFITSSSINEMKKIVRKVLKEKSYDFFRKFMELSEGELQRFLGMNLDINKNPVKLFSDFFEQYVQVTTAWNSAIVMGVIIEEYLGEIANQHDFKMEDLMSYTQSDKKTFLGEYEREVKKLRQDNPPSQKKMEALVKKYEWVGTHHFWGEPLTKARLLEQLREKERVEETPKDIAKFPVEVKKVLEVARSLAWLRQYSAEVSDIVSYAARPLLHHLASLINLTYDDIIWLTETEIVEYCSKELPCDIDVEKRKEAVGVYYDNGPVVLDDATLKQFLDTWVAKPEENNELKGMVANKGTVKGKARIVIVPSDTHSFEEGEILIAPETTPDFLPAMRKAKAFVTDTGGITSHAAIVSRELGKPCIVGTKHATRIFKNGDLIEVDADKGVVRKVAE